MSPLRTRAFHPTISSFLFLDQPSVCTFSFFCRDDSSYGLNSLVPLCLWQCFISFIEHKRKLATKTQSNLGNGQKKTFFFYREVFPYFFHLFIQWSLAHMVLQSISAPEGFLALTARKNNAFQMVSFYVIFYSAAHALLSTHFAPMRFLMSICIFILAFFHHRLNLFFKFL